MLPLPCCAASVVCFRGAPPAAGHRQRPAAALPERVLAGVQPQRAHPSPAAHAAHRGGGHPHREPRPHRTHTHHVTC